MDFINEVKLSGTTCALKPLDRDGYLGGSLQIKTYSHREDCDFRETFIDVFLTKDDYCWCKANGVEELMPIVVDEHKRMVRANETSKKKYFNIELTAQIENWIPRDKNGNPNLKKKKNIFVCRSLKSVEREKSV